MNLHKCIFTHSYTYSNMPNLSQIKGIMVHSTGANNPKLRRYVGPDDGLLGPTSTMNWNQKYINGQLFQLGVHAFIGKLKDGTVATYQVQNWNKKCYHCGHGPTGASRNSSYVAFEICEDGLNDREYFNAIYKEAAELCAYLCKMFNLNPLTQIECHQEGYRKGYASNHADVLHWFPKFGKSMDDFRKYVKQIMENGIDDIDEEDEDMTDEKFAEMMKRYNANLGKTKFNGTGTYLEEYNEAKELGITDGSSPNGHATRAQVAVMSLRVYKLVKKLMGKK